MQPRHRTPGRRPAVLIALAALLAATPAALAQPAIDCQTELLGSSPIGDYFSVNIATGAGTSIATLPPNLATELEYDIATDTLWADEVNGLPDLHMIDPVTGASLGTVTHLAGGLTGMELIGGMLYGAFIPGPLAPSDLVIVDTTTGNFTTLGATGFGPVSGLAYDEGSGVLYGITAGGAPADLITLDLGNGAGTVVGATGLDFIGSIEFGPDGNLYGGLTGSASSNGQFLVRIDTATGAATPIGASGFDISGLTACAAGVDEPDVPIVEIPTLSGVGLALMILALAAASLWLMRRQRRHGTRLSGEAVARRGSLSPRTSLRSPRPSSPRSPAAGA